MAHIKPEHIAGSALKAGLVSVVVASYNHAAYLVRRLDSLLEQTCQGIEILVIDDCSTENNVEILRRYESNPKIRLVFNQKNSGIVSVMNQGIELTSGEFVMFAQCDDDCNSCLIERLLDAIRAHPSAGIAFCRSELIDETDQVIGDDFAFRERSFRIRCASDTLVRREEMNRFLMVSCVIPNLSAALIRRDCFVRLGALSPSYRVCLDWDFFFRVATSYDFYFLARPLNKFRQHETSIRSVTKTRVVYAEYLRVLLGQMGTLDLTMLERVRFRTRVMHIWAAHLLSRDGAGLINFSFHAGLVMQLDPAALLFLGPGLLLRAAQMFGTAAVADGRIQIKSI